MYYNIGVAPNAKSDLNMQNQSMKTNETACQKGLQISKTNYLVPIVLALVIILTASIRYRLIDVPLERDEGEYAYAGQLMLEGIAPYTQVYNMKLPGIYAAYAVILAIFGQTHSGIHLGLLCINAATIVILFLLTKKLFGSIAGLAGAAFFAILSTGISVQGIFANAEHFVILPACGGLLLMVYARERNKLWMLFAGGLLLGIGFLMKQHGAMFIAFGGIYLFFSELKDKTPLTKLISRCLLYILAALLPFVITCAILVKAGVFGKFWFWTFKYASQYVSSIPFSNGMRILASRIGPIINSSRLIWILSLIGLVSLILSKANRKNRWFGLGFVMFSFLAVCLGFYFRPHYFVLLLPAAAVLAGVGADTIFKLFNKSRYSVIAFVLPVILSAVVLGESFYKQWDYLFVHGPNRISRMVYGAEAFPESLEIAKYIKEHTDEDARIAVMGSEPQIYFYSDRKSATGHIYTYALMETHPYALTMQEEMISEIESATPEFIVFVRIHTSWLYQPDSNKTIFKWFDNYVKQYECIGVVDILSADRTNYVWDEQAKHYSPSSNYWLKVYRRKNLQ